MKTFKLFWIIAIIVVIGFSLATCDGDKGNETKQTACKNHNWDWTINAIPADCTNANFDTATCKNTGCNATDERTGNTSALGHKGVGAVQPTCTTPDNTGIGICERCEEEVTGEEIPVDENAHDWEWTIPADCLNDSLPGDCSREDCEVTNPEEIELALGHNLQPTENITTPPTCTETGIGEVACLNCNYTEASGVVAVLGHTFAATIPATCITTSVPGTCTRADCEVVNPEAVVQALGHVF